MAEIKQCRLIHVEQAAFCDECGEELILQWATHGVDTVYQHCCVNGHTERLDRGYPYKEWVRQPTRVEFHGFDGDRRMGTRTMKLWR